MAVGAEAPGPTLVQTAAVPMETVRKLVACFYTYPG